MPSLRSWESEREAKKEVRGVETKGKELGRIGKEDGRG